jgi:small-conductance mechanosensitive channel
VVSYLAYQLVFYALRKRMIATGFTLPSLIRKHTRSAGFITLFAFLLVVLMPLLPIPVAWLGFINKSLLIFQIFCVAWLLISLIRALREFILEQYTESAGGNNMRIRSVYTQYKIFERILVIIIGLLAVIAVLMTFENVRQLGVSLLASAGVAGVIIGFAAQKSLAGILAGIQIAISQRIRIDDVVVVEGDWGVVEEITLTYVVIKLWDDRRLVVPIAFFIEKPFHNWTRTSEAIKGAVILQVDLTADVMGLRAYYLERIAANPLWDGRDSRVQVVDVQDRLQHLRFVCSARNADDLFDLRCEMREELLKYVATHLPQSLPRNRIESIPFANSSDQSFTH